MDEESFLENTFFEIQYETYEEDQYCGDIRRLSQPNDIVFTHEMAKYIDDNIHHECIDYLSTDQILYMSIAYGYNDETWKSQASVVKKHIIIEEEGRKVLNERKEIQMFDQNIRQQFVHQKKKRAVSGIYLIDPGSQNEKENETLEGWPFKKGHRDLLANKLHIDNAQNLDLQLFFIKGQPRQFVVKAFTENMFIEK